MALAVALVLAEQGFRVLNAAPHGVRARPGAAGEAGQSPLRVMRGCAHRAVRRIVDWRDQFVVGVAVDRLA
jgi:hypothetical protein